MVDGHFKHKVGAIIQVRMGSTRLPGKVLKCLPANGAVSVLQHILNRVPKSYESIIATSTSPKDDQLISNFPNAFRGDEEDVLSRFYQCAKLNNLSVIIRLTGDNPLIDGKKMSQVVEYHLENKFDYTCSEGLPLGCNFEVFNFEALEMAASEAESSFDREHVTPFIKKHSKFKRGVLKYDNFPNYRLTLDYPSDYIVMNSIFETVGEQVTLEDAIRFLKSNPDIAKLNQTNSQLS